MTAQLPDAREKIRTTARKAFFQRLITPPLLFVPLGILLVIGVGVIGVVYWSQQRTPGPEPSPAIAVEPPDATETPTRVQPEEIATQEVASVPPTEPPTAQVLENTAEPTPEPTPQPPTVEPTQEPTATPTLQPTVKPTPPPAVEPTPSPTIEPTLTPTVESTPTLAPSPTTVVSPVTVTAINASSLPGKIAVPVFNSQTNTYDLYIASAPDWQLQLFQTGASQAAFSPDGSQIVFRSWGGPSTSYSEQLVIRSDSGSGERMITNHPEDARPHWANFEFPIVFHTRPSGSSAHIYFQALWESAPQDADSRRESVVGENPTWLPDGRIVYFSGEPSGNGLYVMTSNDLNSRKLIWSSGSAVAPKGDPTSTRVIFSNEDDLYLLSVTEGASQPQALLTTPDERERLPVWSPDGQFIAYVKDHADEKWAVYVIRSDGTGQTKLFDLPGSINGKPFNVPDNRALGWYEEQLAWGR